MITKQTLYKELKEKKLFSKYCLTIASAFCKDNNPRAEKDDYENGWLSERLTDTNSVKCWYPQYLLKIQQ